VEDGLKNRFFKNPRIKTQLPDIITAIKNGGKSPTAAARELLSLASQ
jgi:hypothetical protein